MTTFVLPVVITSFGPVSPKRATTQRFQPESDGLEIPNSQAVLWLVGKVPDQYGGTTAAKTLAV